VPSFSLPRQRETTLTGKTSAQSEPDTISAVAGYAVGTTPRNVNGTFVAQRLARVNVAFDDKVGVGALRPGRIGLDARSRRHKLDVTQLQFSLNLVASKKQIIKFNSIR